jgi:MSHA pilin protein MshC
MKIAESLQSLIAAKRENALSDGLFAAPVMRRLASRPRSPGQSGFTMIELVTIMLLVGILAVVALPRFDLLRGFDEIGYRDQVKATLEYARKSAVAQRRQVRVTIVGSGLTLDHQRQTPEGEGVAGWLPLNLPGSGTNSFAAPSGVSLTPAADTVSFDALGRPDAAKSYVVSGGGGTIIVEAETGYVH